MLILRALAVALILALVVAAPVAAKRPRQLAATGNETLSVSPSPVPAQSSFQVGGCGYTPNSSVRLILEAPGVLAFWGGAIGADGCYYNTVGYATNPGTATLTAYVTTSYEVLAATTFEIVP